jgi:hypothetical protein
MIHPIKIAPQDRKRRMGLVGTLIKVEKKGDPINWGKLSASE